MKRIVNDMEFITVYLDSDSRRQVAERLDVTESYVSNRAAFLRDKGVSVPKRNTTITDDDIERLNEVIIEYMEQNS